MGRELVCDGCGKFFTKENKYYNQHVIYNMYDKFYCSQECQRHNQSDFKVTVSCLNCGKEFKKLRHELLRSPNSFCSKNCTAVYHNARRVDVKYSCNICGIEVIGTIGLGQSRAKCDSCKAKHKHEVRSRPRMKICLKCGREVELPGQTKLCKPCQAIVRSELGHRNGMLQHTNRRSKNEIAFAELCKQHFHDVLENPKMFDGWDADVVIPSIKIAVLWNGRWHYVDKIRSNHSLKQIQNRDRLKIKHIKANGYEPYIIKDMSCRHNMKFVQVQFDEFLAKHKT